MREKRRIAYVSLQAVAEGQDTWAAVMEIIGGFEAEDWAVDYYFPDYPKGVNPSAVMRIHEIRRVQMRLAPRLREYDAVYIRGHELAWPIAVLAKLRRVPVVQECNGPYEDLFIAWPKARPARLLLEWMQRSQYRWATAVITVADGLREWVIAETGNERVVSIGNGANTEVFAPTVPRRPGLPERFAVFFGQFARWQGIGTLLEAVALPEWPTGIPLVFFGDGVMLPQIEKAVEDVPDRVIYLGGLPYNEVATVVAHSVTSFVPMLAPEREELFSPLKLYESMACGVPVVASNTRGISEVVNEWRCGILVTPGDAPGFARATAALADDPEMAGEMGRRGRLACEAHYSWLARAKQRLAVVEGAIGQGRVRPIDDGMA